MVVRADNGVLRTEPIEVDPPDADGASSVIHDDALNTWFEASFNRFIEYHVLGAEGDDSSGFYGRTVMKAVGMALDERVGPLEQQAKQIDELRLQLATVMGALDVLRAQGAPGGFDVLRQQMLDSVGEALGMARPDFEDKLAVQAKRIGELELKLAEAVGALNVLRGRGVPGSLNVRGTFDPGVSYVYGDVAMLGGSSWVATKDRPGLCPGDGWQLLASAGKRGRRGERGPSGAPGPVGEKGEGGMKGEQGERGLIGPTGEPAPTITGWRVDCVAYAAVPLLSDGSEGASLELRSLFKQFLDEVAPRA
jgi:Collagen triple helix repeat (20 copies)